MSVRSKISALQLTLFTVAFLSPLSVAGQATCTVNVTDTIAGLGTLAASTCAPQTGTALMMENPVGSVFSIAGSDGAFSISAEQTMIAGAYTVTLGTASAAFDVLPDQPTQGRVVAEDTILNIGEETIVTAVLFDQYDNAVTGFPMVLVSGRPSDRISPLSSLTTDGDGRMSWEVQANSAGTMSLSLYNPIAAKPLKIGTTVTVGGKNILVADLGMGQNDDVLLGADLSNGVVDSFELSLPEDAKSVPPNALFSMEVRAVDSNGVTVRSFVGTLIFESSDNNAVLPKIGEDPQRPNQGRFSMNEGRQGIATIPLAFLFRSLGEQTITVFDKMNPDVKGEITLTVTGKLGSDDGSINVVSPIPGATIGSHTFELIIKDPKLSFVDYVIRGTKSGTPITLGADANGIAKGTIQADETLNTVTLFISRQDGSEKVVTYIIDTTKPVIELITMNPEQGKTDDTANITVKSEAGLVSVIAILDDVETILTASETDPTLYIGTVTAPGEPGPARVTVQVRDGAGNSAEMGMQWDVASKEIRQVKGLQAMGQALQVALTWDPVGETDVKEYKIYIAREDDPENFLYSIGTEKPVTAAVIRDLPLIGSNYLFFLTAVDTAGTESKEKSDGAAASPLGMRLVTTAGDQSLLIEWNAIANLPLSHYNLAFGIGDNVENKTVNGAAESFMLRDLLPGIEYSIRLTPIALTGQTRADLAATTYGTPTGRGFAIGSTEPVPPNTFKDLHSGAPRQPIRSVPTVPNTGIPTAIFMTILVGALVAFGLYMRQVNGERRRTRAFLESMQHRYHS